MCMYFTVRSNMSTKVKRNYRLSCLGNNFTHSKPRISCEQIVTPHL